MEHLQLGGDVFDDVGRSLVVKFAQAAYGDSGVASIAERHRISINDICVIYAAMIKALMPNPCINSGGLLLVPTLFFMEPVRFEALASEIAARANALPEDERRQKMMALAGESGRQVWQAHTTARGKANFKIENRGGRKSAGCAAVLACAAMLIGGLIYVVN